MIECHSSSSLVIIFLLAIVFDLVFGDKDTSFHPIRLMGAAISFFEKWGRASSLDKRLSGAFICLVLVIASFSVTFFCGRFFKSISQWAFILFSAFIIYFGICLRCLADEAKRVHKLLINGKLDDARKRLSYLVSRDTENMGKGEISRSVIETVSENLVDGIYSPFFYGAIGGPSFVMSFKMVSTLDSMIGYKNKEYKDLGLFSARFDDLLNFVPARLSPLFIALSALILFKKNPVSIILGAYRQSRYSESPNSGFPEAAFALALGVRLGGPTSYARELKMLPVINKNGKQPEIEDIRHAIRLLYLSGILFYFCFILLLLLTF